MDVSGQIMTSSEAAAVLGVSLRRVQMLAAAGEITVASHAGRTLLLDATSVNQRVANNGRAGRALTENNAWAAIDILSTGRTERVDGSERSRLRSRLRRATATELLLLCRRRATVTRYRSYASARHDLRRSVMLTGDSAIGSHAGRAKTFGLSAGASDVLDAYVVRSELDVLSTDLSLVQRRSGNTILRATDAQIRRGGVADDVTIALDLADSLDERARDAGLTYLADRIGQL